MQAYNIGAYTRRAISATYIIQNLTTPRSTVDSWQVYLDVPQLSNLNAIIKVVSVKYNQHLCTLYAYKDLVFAWEWCVVYSCKEKAAFERRWLEYLKSVAVSSCW